MSWNSVNECLPKKNGSYLVTVIRTYGFSDTFPATTIAYYENEQWLCTVEKVIGWQELPSPKKIDNSDLNRYCLSQMTERAEQFNPKLQQDWRDLIEAIDYEYNLDSILDNDKAFAILKTKFRELYIKSTEGDK